MRYRAIFFDLDGTLLFSDPDVWPLYAQFAQEAGLRIPPDGLHQAERFAHAYFSGNSFLTDRERLGEAGFRLYYLKRILQAAQCAGDLENAAQHIHTQFAGVSRKAFVPDEAHTTLQALRARGYTLGLVTNRSADEMARSFEPHRLRDYFQFIVTASDVTLPKPHRAMFDLALAHAQCDPMATMHVGDNFYADIGGAQPLGITPILLDPKGLFPEARCITIQQMPQLLEHLI